MNFYIQQSIQIQMIRIGTLANSSVFQIGSSGIIKPASYLYNTGGFVEPAPKALLPGESVHISEGKLIPPSVPLGRS